jgi:hypothetical protein
MDWLFVMGPDNEIVRNLFPIFSRNVGTGGISQETFSVTGKKSKLDLFLFLIYCLPCRKKGFARADRTPASADSWC